MVSCKDEPVTEEPVVQLTLCDCITPTADNQSKCDSLFPTPLTAADSAKRLADLAICNGGSLDMSDTTLTQVEIDSAVSAYENDMSLEIKALPEEKLDPISDECKTFLEEYAASIKSFSALLNKIEKNPEDINLMIARPQQEEELYSFASKPQMFKCSQNEVFKKQVEILNNKRDKLLSN